MTPLKFLFVATFCLCTALSSFRVSAQENQTDFLQHCKDRTDAAWQFAGDAAHELQFNNGANTTDEVRSHCFDALVALDSLDMALQQAIYDATDAASELKTAGANQAYSGMGKVKTELKEATKFLDASKKYLQTVLDESNIDTINQQLFDTVENLESCRQHIKRAQAGLKAIQKSLPK